MRLRDMPELWAVPSTGQLVAVHPPEACAPPCPIHAPSDHKMRAWPLYICGIRLVRLCAHGVCHPDPDDVTNIKLGTRSFSPLSVDHPAWTEHQCCSEHCCEGAYSLGC